MDNLLFITSCEKTNDGKYSITFSNGCTEKFNEHEVMEHYLYEDSVPLKISYEQLMKEVNKKRAVTSIISYVAITLRTVKQTEDKLIQQGYSIDIATDVIEYLERLGYLNDKEYARKYVNTCLKTKIISQKMCEFELIRKGISEQIAAEAVELIDDNEQAKKLYNKKLKSQKDKLKLKKYLYSKGFTQETINHIITDDIY